MRKTKSIIIKHLIRYVKEECKIFKEEQLIYDEQLKSLDVFKVIAQNYENKEIYNNYYYKDIREEFKGEVEDDAYCIHYISGALSYKDIKKVQKEIKKEIEEEWEEFLENKLLSRRKLFYKKILIYINSAIPMDCIYISDEYIECLDDTMLENILISELNSKMIMNINFDKIITLITAAASLLSVIVSIILAVKS